MRCSLNIICMKNLPSLHFFLLLLFFFRSDVAARRLMDRTCHLVQCWGQEVCFPGWGGRCQETADPKVKGTDLTFFVCVNYQTLTGKTTKQGQGGQFEPLAIEFFFFFLAFLCFSSEKICFYKYKFQHLFWGKKNILVKSKKVRETNIFHFNSVPTFHHLNVDSDLIVNVKRTTTFKKCSLVKG